VIGTEKLPVPVNRSAENVSPKPTIAPPPDGSEITDPPAVASVLLPPIGHSLLLARTAAASIFIVARNRAGAPGETSPGRTQCFVAMTCAFS
jgi:hypothetical protein